MKTFRELVKGFGQKEVISETTSCCGGSGHLHHTHHNQEDSQAKEVYQCPMKCEGDKTYDEAGRCPVCGMFLAPVKN